RDISPKTKSLTGYTLIETLIAVSILVLMSGVVMGFNRETRQQLMLTIDQARLVGILTRAKSFALGRYIGTVEGGGTASISSCAFGVSFDTSATPNRMILFQDLPAVSPCGRCVCDGAPSFNKRYDGGDELLEAVRLGDGIRVDSSAADIAFEAPYLKTYSGGFLLDQYQPTATITLRIFGTTRAASARVGSGAHISSF
ncbi:MAG: hypothetical protein AAB601_03525, partial [Patescibacteria group bacterium]